MNNVGHPTTYADWSKIDHPEIIQSYHISLMKETGYLFARKFNDDSSEVVELIEKELRH